MPTTVTHTIGTSGDYATPALWEDGTDDTSLVTADEVRVGECLNQEFSGSGQQLAVGGATTDATRYRHLTAAAGASFADHADKLTNALRYNASNGAGIRGTSNSNTTCTFPEDYFRVSRMQIAASGTSTAIAITAPNTGLVIERCIVEGANAGTSGIVDFSGTNWIARNCLFVQRANSASRIIDMAFADGGVMVNCTGVVPSDLTAATNFARLDSTESSLTFRNVAAFGIGTAVFSGTATPTIETCMTDVGSPPTGFSTVTYSNQFENTADSTRDFRLKSGADCIDAGTTDSTHASADIVSTSRPSGSAYDIGAWESSSGGTGTEALSGQASTGEQTAPSVGMEVPL